MFSLIESVTATQTHTLYTHERARSGVINGEIRSLCASVMNERKIIPPQSSSPSLFVGESCRALPLINTSIWPPDIPNLPTGSPPLCPLMDRALDKGLSAPSLPGSLPPREQSFSPNLFPLTVASVASLTCFFFGQTRREFSVVLNESNDQQLDLHISLPLSLSTVVSLEGGRTKVCLPRTCSELYPSVAAMAEDKWRCFHGDGFNVSCLHILRG